MKKFTAIIAAALLALSISVPAFAENDSSVASDEQSNKVSSSDSKSQSSVKETTQSKSSTESSLQKTSYSKYKLSDVGMQISLPDNMYVLTRDMDENAPALKACKLTKASVLKSFKSSDTYIKATAHDFSYDITVTMVKNSNTENIDDLTSLNDDDVQQVIDKLLEKNVYTGCSKTKYNNTSFLNLNLQYNSSNTKIYGLQEYTIIKGTKVVITFQSYNGTMTQAQKSLMNTIMNGVTFEGVDTSKQQASDIGSTSIKNLDKREIYIIGLSVLGIAILASMIIVAMKYHSSSKNLSKEKIEKQYFTEEEKKKINKDNLTKDRKSKKGKKNKKDKNYKEDIKVFDKPLKDKQIDNRAKENTNNTQNKSQDDKMLIDNMFTIDTENNNLIYEDVASKEEKMRFKQEQAKHIVPYLDSSEKETYESENPFAVPDISDKGINTESKGNNNLIEKNVSNQNEADEQYKIKSYDYLTSDNNEEIIKNDDNTLTDNEVGKSVDNDEHNEVVFAESVTHHTEIEQIGEDGVASSNTDGNAEKTIETDKKDNKDNKEQEPVLSEYEKRFGRNKTISAAPVVLVDEEAKTLSKFEKHFGKLTPAVLKQPELPKAQEKPIIIETKNNVEEPTDFGNDNDENSDTNLREKIAIQFSKRLKKVEIDDKPIETKTEDKAEAKPIETKTEDKTEAKPIETKAENKTEAKPIETKAEEKTEAKPTEIKVEDKTEAKPIETKAEEKTESKPIETKTEEKTESKPTETKVEEKTEAKPIETKTEDKTEAKPIETKTEDKTEAKPIETKAEEKTEAKPTETKAEDKTESKPTETKAEEKTEAKPTETKVEDKTESKPTETKVEKKSETINKPVKEKLIMNNSNNRPTDELNKKESFFAKLKEKLFLTNDDAEDFENIKPQSKTLEQETKNSFWNNIKDKLKNHSEDENVTSLDKSASDFDIAQEKTIEKIETTEKTKPVQNIEKSVSEKSLKSEDKSADKTSQEIHKASNNISYEKHNEQQKQENKNVENEIYNANNEEKPKTNKNKQIELEIQKSDNGNIIIEAVNKNDGKPIDVQIKKSTLKPLKDTVSKADTNNSFDNSQIPVENTLTYKSQKLSKSEKNVQDSKSFNKNQKSHKKGKKAKTNISDIDRFDSKFEKKQSVPVPSVDNNIIKTPTSEPMPIVDKPETEFDFFEGITPINDGIFQGDKNIANDKPLEKIADSAKNDKPLEKIADSAKNDKPLEKIADSAKNDKPLEKIADGAKNDKPLEKIADGAKNDKPLEKIADNVKNDKPLEKIADSTKINKPLAKVAYITKSDKPLTKLPETTIDSKIANESAENIIQEEAPTEPKFNFEIESEITFEHALDREQPITANVTPFTTIPRLESVNADIYNKQMEEFKKRVPQNPSSDFAKKFGSPSMIMQGENSKSKNNAETIYYNGYDQSKDPLANEKYVTEETELKKHKAKNILSQKTGKLKKSLGKLFSSEEDDNRS